MSTGYSGALTQVISSLFFMLYQICKENIKHLLEFFLSLCMCVRLGEFVISPIPLLVFGSK